VLLQDKVLEVQHLHLKSYATTPIYYQHLFNISFNRQHIPAPVLLQDKVLEVQPEQLLNDGGSATGGSVRLASGGSIEYDWLVVSLGAAADPRGVPGVREHARPFVSLEDAEYVAQQMAVYEARAAMGQPPATVAVVGAGYAGVELAAVVGERLKGKARVVLLTPGADILEAAPAGQREAAVQVRVWCTVAF
jgi:NADH dehydrogenase FAD-containing subunit